MPTFQPNRYRQRYRPARLTRRVSEGKCSMPTVHRWTGVEVRALRDAMRMSLREFAAHLGVSERMVSKWEAGRENIQPRPVNQAALDTCLNRSDPDTHARFAFLVGDSVVSTGEQEAQIEPIGSGQ